jgi:hypothetical protein
MNENFNTQDVVVYIYENQLIWEPGEFENFDNLTGSHQPQKHYVLENRSGSHNITREPGPSRFSHKKRSENRPTRGKYMNLIIFLATSIES